jgi:trehalose synthase
MRGGGVAEMLHSMLPYSRGAGIDTRWVVLRERPEFFVVTKRLHNHLHGDPGDGGVLGEEERGLYQRTLEESARHLVPLLRERDIVFLHDPQTAGLAPSVKETGVSVVWRCHIGADRPDQTVRAAWDFLAPSVRDADAYVFSRREYVWDALDPERARVMAPSIDPFSPKNEELDAETVEGIVDVIGLGDGDPALAPVFVRADGTPARVERPAEILQEDGLPPGAPMVAQISRWDRLKDHRGLLTCFDRHVAAEESRLVLAGPATNAVSDDPEGAVVWRDLCEAWRALPPGTRRRAHLVSLPMDDPDENAVMVNALQRRAGVVVQKSLAEGFGLTVAEAMWKRRPVVGSRVGGIQDQIADGESGLLIDDPRDLEGFGEAITTLIEDEPRAAEIGVEGRRRVFDRFLVANRLAEYVDLLVELDEARSGR